MESVHVTEEAGGLLGSLSKVDLDNHAFSPTPTNAMASYVEVDCGVCLLKS